MKTFEKMHYSVKYINVNEDVQRFKRGNDNSKLLRKSAQDLLFYMSLHQRHFYGEHENETYLLLAWKNFVIEVDLCRHRPI